MRGRGGQVWGGDAVEPPPLSVIRTAPSVIPANAGTHGLDRPASARISSDVRPWVPAFAGMTEVALYAICPNTQRSTAFCACRRFSASAQISDCGPSITASTTSSPRCAGRQWRKRASGFARAISASST